MENMVLKKTVKALEIELFLSRYGFCKIDLTKKDINEKINNIIFFVGNNHFSQ